MIRSFLLFSYLFMLYSFANGQDIPMKLFQLDELSRENGKTEEPYHRFLEEASLSMGLYELSAGAKDHQEPHQRDEIYYITEGKASLSVGDDMIAVEPGAIIFVKAEVPHRFFDITEDLQVLVVFSNTESSTEDPDWLVFELSELTKEQQPDKNVWNQFLDISSMRFGLYMLPVSIGGDSILTHQVDEINIVVSGRSKFRAADDEIDVKPGSIFYVKKGVGHQFHSIKDESIYILILFHKK